MNAFQNCRVHNEGKFGITEFLNAVVLTAKILVDCAACVVGIIKEVGDFADVSSEAWQSVFRGPGAFQEPRMCIFVIREEVCDDSVRDRIDDVKDTSKIGA